MKVNLIRYADDFCITGDSKELLEQEVKPLVEQFLGERGLELSTAKTVVTHIEQGFQPACRAVEEERADGAGLCSH